MRPFIPDEEFAQRVVNTQASMKEEGLDLLLCFGSEAEPQFVRYYSDYWPSFETAGVLIPQEGEAALLIGPESGTYAADNSKIRTIYRLLAFRESSEPEYPGVVLETFDSVIGKVYAGKTISKIGIAGYSLIFRIHRCRGCFCRSFISRLRGSCGFRPFLHLFAFCGRFFLIIMREVQFS